MNAANVPAEVVVTRMRSGGLAGLDETLTVYADGTLHLLDRRFQKDETRTVQPRRLAYLRSALATKNWQSIEPFFGQPVPDGFEIRVSGGGRDTGFADPSDPPVEIPPILAQVLAMLDRLWSSAAPGGDDGGTPADLYELEGEGTDEDGRIRVTYQASPGAPSLHYRDARIDRVLGDDELRTAEIAAGTCITGMLELESHGAYYLDLILPSPILEGPDDSIPVRAPAIQTKIRGGFIPEDRVEFNIVWLPGTARKAATAPLRAERGTVSE
jgi:hypothetical protein